MFRVDQKTRQSCFLQMKIQARKAEQLWPRGSTPPVMLFYLFKNHKQKSILKINIKVLFSNKWVNKQNILYKLSPNFFY